MRRLVYVRVRRTTLASVVLCGLAIALPAGSPGPWLVPGFALAAENGDQAGDKPETPEQPEDAGTEPEATKDDEDDDPEDAADESEADESEADESEADESEADESEEVFVPSENISEDIDVPFPVDI